MRLPLLLPLALLACSRPAAPSRATQAPAPAAAPAQAAPPRAAADPAAAAAERERAEIAERAANLSRFPSTDEGARAFITELVRASASGDAERIERAAEELQADEARLGTGFTFEGARALSPRLLPTMEPAGRALRARLAPLREPLTVNLSSALGNEITDGSTRGFDPRIASVRTMLRPMVRYYRAEVVGAQGSGRVVIEPLSWLAGRWTWLGEPWAALTPAVPEAPAAPPARR